MLTVIGSTPPARSYMTSTSFDPSVRWPASTLVTTGTAQDANGTEATNTMPIKVRGPGRPAPNKRDDLTFGEHIGPILPEQH